MNRRIIELVRQTGSSRKFPLRRFVGTVPEIDPLLLPAEGDEGSLIERRLLRHRFADDQVVEISASRQPDGGVVLLARDVTAMDRQEVEAARAQRLDFSYSQACAWRLRIYPCSTPKGLAFARKGASIAKREHAIAMSA